MHHKNTLWLRIEEFQAQLSKSSIETILSQLADFLNMSLRIKLICKSMLAPILKTKEELKEFEGDSKLFYLIHSIQILQIVGW